MARSEFIPQYFKIEKLSKKISLLETIKNLKIPLTYNQLMKFDGKIDLIFIFDEKSIEIPSLLSFCHYFKIKIFILGDEDINEIKLEIKHAQMVCIPNGCSLIKSIEDSIANLDISRIRD